MINATHKVTMHTLPEFGNVEFMLSKWLVITSSFCLRVPGINNIPLTIPPITPLPQQSIPTPTPAPKTATTTTSIPALPHFSSLFGFDQRVFALEKELSQFKQANYSAQLLKTIKSQIPAMVDAQLCTRLEDSIKKQESTSSDLPKEVSDYATPVIQSSIIESLENIVLVKSSCQPKSTYEAAASLTKFELKKILLDKI
ncbi:hypothetical protein Tco_1131734 [Tanacetum coccineum]|uniref:Uncharacterized protein n=1 Tax=Tanacetum coccineum TaxID=301880 RepID=A0ABQ5J9Z6_9ASTR